MKFDKTFIAQMNKKNVLDIIRTKGPINKSQIAKLAELSIPTVMKISDEFVEAGLIQATGKGESRGGKRPEMLELISNAYYMVGVDMGRSKTISIIMNLNGDILNKKVMKTGSTNPAGKLLDRVICLIDGTIQESGIPAQKILGIGVVTPGLIEKESDKIIFSPDFQWENVDIKTSIEEEFQMPVRIENSNRALALGEGWFGAAEHASYYICINLGHGIGSAIVEKGRFYLGNSGSSGEIGHMTLEKDGAVCDCGNRGCLEALASGNAIAEQAKKEIRNGRKTLIMEYVDDDIEKIEAKNVFDAAKMGDELAVGITDNAVGYIGIGIANYINLLDPEMIVLAGGMMNAGDFFVGKLERAIQERKMKFAGSKVKFEVSKLGADAAAIGAASLILRNFIEHGGSTRERRKNE
ncbi:ROK family transcriptional regulator [Muricomes intestini]|jgi:glucokinase-like ROK family protein